MLTTVLMNASPDETLNALRLFQPGKPFMVSEFWTGYPDSWGLDHQTMPMVQFTHVADVMLTNEACLSAAQTFGFGILQN